MKGGKSQIDFMPSCLSQGEVVKGDSRLWNLLTLTDDVATFQNFKPENDEAFGKYKGGNTLFCL